VTAGRIWVEVEVVADDESPDLLIVELPEEPPETPRRGRRPQRPARE
jgi:hypothetical protein